MSGWICVKGESLLIPSGPDDKSHLFAILLDPVLIPGYGSKPHVLLASVVSTKPGLLIDESCLLHPGDHPFIGHNSFVDYRFTRLEPAAHMESRVHEGMFHVKEPCSTEMLKRIVAGALKSKRISREHKIILENVIFGD